MNNEICFLTCAFTPPYVEQQHRLKASIRNFYPEAQIMAWTNTYPEGSKPHKESPYGFKVHAVNAALRQGYEKIIWCDSALVFQKPVEYWFGLTEKYGMIAAKDDNLLKNHCDDYYPMQDDWNLIGGSHYVWDMANRISRNVIQRWKEYEEAGMFKGKESKHRHDEAMGALALYLSGSEPVPYDICRYNNGPESIVQKFHFK